MSFLMTSKMMNVRSTKRVLSLPRVFSTKSYTETQQALKRPLSPHVTIYDFPVTAISSIFVRVTGVVLSVGMAGVGTLAFVGADVPGVIDTVKNIPGLTPTLKFTIAFPLIYHYMGGVRHLIWDKMPHLLETSRVAPTSYGLLGAATLLSLGVCCYTPAMKKVEDQVHDE